jgi:hypothetical protein
MVAVMTRLEALIALREVVEAGRDDLDVLGATTQSEIMFGHSGNYVYVIDAYRGSIDAARKLHQAVLPGWEWEIASSDAAAVFKGDVLRGPAELAAATCPARAWLLAILSALIAQEQSQ